MSIVGKPLSGEGRKVMEKLFGSHRMERGKKTRAQKTKEAIKRAGIERIDPKEQHQQFRVVDTKGRPKKLNAWERNRLYSKAKDMERDIKDLACTNNELWRATEKDVEKCGKESGRYFNDLVNRYRNTMMAIGAEPADCDHDRHRRDR